MQSCDCLIIYSDRKSSDCIINSDNNNDVVAEISIREKENSKDNITEKKNENRRNKEKDKILSDNLKETEEEENIIFINREIC